MQFCINSCIDPVQDCGTHSCTADKLQRFTCRNPVAVPLNRILLVKCMNLLFTAFLATSDDKWTTTIRNMAEHNCSHVMGKTERRISHSSIPEKLTANGLSFTISTIWVCLHMHAWTHSTRLRVYSRDSTKHSGLCDNL